MNANRMLKLLIAVVLFTAGLCLPFAARSRSIDWDTHAGLIQNVRQSHITLLPDTRKPIFEPVAKGGENPSAFVVQFEETELFLEFNPSVATAEMQNAIRAHFPRNHIPPGDPVSGRIRFEGWAGHAARTAPFGSALALGLILILGAGILAKATFPGSGRGA